MCPYSAYVLDIDLAILAQPWLRFLDFECGIAEEYANVPKPLLMWKRRSFLRGLLASAQIFRTDAMRARHEAAARTNLNELLASARYSVWSWWT